MSKSTFGILLLLLSTIGYAISHAMVKAMSIYFTPVQLGFFRFLVGPMLFLPFFMALKVPLKINNWPLMLFRIVIGLIGMIFYFTALQQGDAGKATLIFQAGALWTYILAAIVLKEFPSIQTKIFVPIAFIGLFMVIDPDFSTGIQLADIYALAGSLCLAGVSLSLKTLRTNHNAQSIMIFNYCLGSLFLFPALLMAPLPSVNLLAQHWPTLIILTIVGFLANWVMTVGYKYVTSGLSSSLLLLVVPLMYMIGYSFFGESLSMQGILGTLIMFGSLMIVSWYR